MRRTEIMVTRDNPQNLHQPSSTTRITDNESTTIDNNSTICHNKMETISIEDDILFEKKKSIIILLGRLLLKCGCPCHRVHDILQQASSALLLDASFSFLPDSVMISFTDSIDTQSVMVKSPQGYDNGKIAMINDIMNDFFREEVDIDRCFLLLHDVATAPPTCGMLGTIMFFVLGSFGVTGVMFQGTWMDTLISTFLGLLVAMLYIISAQFPIYAKIFEISVSICVSIICRALHDYCCFSKVAMSALLILLPGYTITIGVVSIMISFFIYIITGYKFFFFILII
ncbi:hypothetical protein BDB01DRAFT_713791 [Pilobolus umbonatus]|nr:hypothetical protein BDB01DRAFT_713791 [Pilobolus umbonatus]